MKNFKNFFLLVIISILLCTACTPYFTTSEPLLLADTETEVLVNCYDYTSLRHRKLVEFTITVNDTLSSPPISSFVYDEGFDIEEGHRYDVKVLDKSVVYVFDIIPTINEQDICSGMPISAAELYDTIMSQKPELIGTHVLKIDDNEKHDIREFAYDYDHSFVNFYVDLEGRE